MYALLERQKEDLSELRSQFVSEHRENLNQVQYLQEEMGSLQRKYEQEVATFKTRLQEYTGVYLITGVSLSLHATLTRLQQYTGV